MDDRDLMAIRADTCFTYNARGRMLLTDEPREEERRPAPRLFLGRTLDGDVVRFGDAVPDDLARHLAEIVRRHPASGDLHQPAAMRSALRDALERHTPVAAEEAGPAYRFPVSIARPSEVVRLAADIRAIARDTYPCLYDQFAEWPPCFAVVRDGAAVSVCFSSRIGARAAEAGVETLPAFRGRGYATSVTAAWGAAVRDSGLIPLYSISWENFASQRVARRLGLAQFGADITFS